MKTLVIDEELKRNCQNAVCINAKNLKQILADNTETEFGKQKGFSKIKNIYDYRKYIPIMEYNDFNPYIQKMRQGMKNQLTVYPIISFCQTSGTLGEPKYIPVSQTSLERYSNYFERYKNTVLHACGQKRFLVNSFRTDLSRPIEQVSLFSEIYFRYLYESGLMNMEEYVGGKEMIFIHEEADMLYAKVWAAFLEEDFTLLESQFQYELLHFFSYMEENWRDILRGMREGCIPDEILLPPEIRTKLLSKKASKERLDTIRKECEKGFENIAIRLWKGIRQVSGVSNRAYLTEGAALQRYLGDIPKYYLCYCASECYIGTPLYENEFGYVLMPQNGFFEFLPYDKTDSQTETCLPHEVREGVLYEPVITNFSGLYRYRLGDVVKITGFYGESPVMEFMFRKNQALNIAGEKIDIRQLEDAVYSLREKGIFVEQYCVGASIERLPGKYLATMSLAGEFSKKPPDSREIESLLDQALAQRNPDYADLRRLKELERPRVFLLKGDAYVRFLEFLGMKKKHGHNKPKHICSKEVSEKAWEKYKSISLKLGSTDLD